MKYVNRYTRAGGNGKDIECCECGHRVTVYHFAWSALTCQECDEHIEKEDWYDVSTMFDGVTIKNLKSNKISGFDCGYIAKPEDMCGTMTPFRPHWEVQYLGNGAFNAANSASDAVKWIIEYIDV